LCEISHAKSECSDEEDISHPRDDIPKAECPPGNKLQELVELEMRRRLRKKPKMGKASHVTLSMSTSHCLESIVREDASF